MSSGAKLERSLVATVLGGPTLLGGPARESMADCGRPGGMGDGGGGLLRTPCGGMALEGDAVCARGGGRGGAAG